MATNAAERANESTGLLERLQSLAAWLRIGRWVFAGVLLLGLGTFAAATTGSIDTGWAQPGFISAVWGLLTLTFIAGFRSVPPRIRSGWLRRGLRAIHRGGYWLLALLTLTATIASALLTLRLVLYAG